ncbi:hypothetical protein HDV00_001948 [Rhizophlyctis rosea]|nr:hypothetical protein HDV00_001948 [Rhizophlyctis rosea]
MSYALKFLMQEEADPHGLGYSFEECTAPYLSSPYLVKYHDSFVLPPIPDIPASMLVLQMDDAGKPFPIGFKPPVPITLKVLNNIAGALRYLHSKHIAHGNVGRRSVFIPDDYERLAHLGSLGFARRCAGKDAGEPGPEYLREDVKQLAKLGLEWLVGKGESADEMLARYKKTRGVPDGMSSPFLYFGLATDY